MKFAKATKFYRKSGEGLGYRNEDPERRRRGTPNVGSVAPPALHNLGDPSPSP
jgi:hypothetical protein